MGQLQNWVLAVEGKRLVLRELRKEVPIAAAVEVAAAAAAVGNIAAVADTAVAVAAVAATLCIREITL